jgi:hypothetical protein
VIKVESEVECYEVDGKETHTLNSGRPKIIVRSHWNRSDFVVLEIEGKKLAVVYGDMAAALANAANVPRRS